MSENDDSTPPVIRPKSPVFAPPGPLGKVGPTALAKPPPLPVTDNRALVPPARVVADPLADTARADAGPTVGWLVIIAGPGRGRSLTLGLGMNHLGRAVTNRLVIDFGDEEISRKTHTTVTYDPRGRKFYVQPGPDAVDLTYLGEEGTARPVLTPTEITGGETICLGRTRLRFVPFCGPAFSWD